MTCFFDFDSKLAIRSIGGLIKYFQRFEDDEFEIRFVKPLSLEKILLLDSNSFKALQIFNAVDFSCAYRQSNIMSSNTFRTALTNKNLNSSNITLYGLFLSKMQTKIGVSKLRSFLMRPTRDLNILTERHRVIDAFNSNQNHEFTSQLRKTLKKCKFINSTLKRMKLTRIKWKEWKRLYKTTVSLLQIYELSITFDELINSGNTRHSSQSTKLENQSINNKSSIFENNSDENLFSRINSPKFGEIFAQLSQLFDVTFFINLFQLLFNFD